jgi:hypothetical protein
VKWIHARDRLRVYAASLRSGKRSSQLRRTRSGRNS